MTSCFILRRKDNQDYHSSLGVLEDFGTLESDRGEFIHVSKIMIEKIRRWDRSDCSVVKRVNGADFGGSLEMLNGFHTLEDHITGDEVPVPDSVRTAITDWAEANGY